MIADACLTNGAMYAALCCDGVPMKGARRALDSGEQESCRLDTFHCPTLQHGIRLRPNCSVSGLLASFGRRRPPPRSLKGCWQDIRDRSLCGGEPGEPSAQLSPRLEWQLYVVPCRSHGRVRRAGICPSETFPIARARVDCSRPEAGFRELALSLTSLKSKHADF